MFLQIYQYLLDFATLTVDSRCLERNMRTIESCQPTLKPPANLGSCGGLVSCYIF